MKQKTDLGRLFTCLALLVGAVLTIAPTPGNLKIAEYPGSSEKPGREGTSDIFAVDHEIIQPYDPATGAASGRRQHKPLTVLKLIDKASPGLHRAMATGQVLRSAILDFYRVDPATREEAKYYTITLRNARIVGIKTMMPTSFLPENETYRHMEEVRMVYQSIEWNWIPDGIVESDTWQGVALAPPTAGGLPSAPANVQVQPLNPTPTPTPLKKSSGAAQNAKPATSK